MTINEAIAALKVKYSNWYAISYVDLGYSYVFFMWNDSLTDDEIYWWNGFVEVNKVTKDVKLFDWYAHSDLLEDKEVIMLLNKTDQ